MPLLRFLNAGESHGPEVVAILEGFPAGMPVDIDGINFQLSRRQKAFGSGGRMRIEKDRALLTAGVQAKKTTGGPIALRVVNRDFENWRARNIDPMTTPRPGHADLVGAQKYGYDDLRFSLERALSGYVLITHHRDQPGVVGRIGTILGRHEVNIAGMQVGRRTRGGEAIMVINIDDDAPDAALHEIRSIPGIVNAFVVSLPQSVTATPTMPALASTARR